MTAEAGKCTLARNRGLTLVDLMRPTCAPRLQVTSSILLNLSRGMRLPVGVEMFGDPVHDPFRRFGVGEDPHRPPPPADLPEPSFQDVGGANRLPGCSREREEVEAVEQVLLQTADSRLRLIEPLGPPHLEPPERLGPGEGAPKISFASPMQASRWARFSFTITFRSLWAMHRCGRRNGHPDLEVPDLKTLVAIAGLDAA